MFKRSLHQLHQATIYTLLNTPNDSPGTMKQLRGLYEQTFFTFRTSLVLHILHDILYISTRQLDWKKTALQDYLIVMLKKGIAK